MVASSANQEAKISLGDLDLNKDDLAMVQSYPPVPQGKPASGGIYQKSQASLQLKDVKLPENPIFFLKTKGNLLTQIGETCTQGVEIEHQPSFTVSKVKYNHYTLKSNGHIYILAIQEKATGELVEFLLSASKTEKNEMDSNDLFKGFVKKIELKKGTVFNEKIDKSLKLAHLGFLVGMAMQYIGLADKIEEINPAIREDSFFDFNYLSLLLKAVQLSQVDYLRQQEKSAQSLENIFDTVRI